MHFYIAYGLQIQSQIPLPWLQKGGDGSDVKVIFSDSPTQLDSSEKPNDWAQVKQSEILLFDERAGRVWVRPNLIIITALPGADMNILVAQLLGSGLAAQLIWRDHFVLHASAIRLPDGNAIAFSGNRKAGKSTMAGFFHHQGYPLVSDDVCPLFISNDQTSTSTTSGASKPVVRLHPGFPRLKLDPAILQSMGKNPADYPLLPLKVRVKHSYPANADFDTAPVSLHAIYLLEEADTIRITKLATMEAIVELMRQNFRPFFLASKEQQQKALLACTQIANSISIFKLARPKQTSSISAVINSLLTNSKP